MMERCTLSFSQLHHLSCVDVLSTQREMAKPTEAAWYMVIHLEMRKLWPTNKSSTFLCD